VIVTTNLHVEL